MVRKQWHLKNILINKIDSLNRHVVPRGKGELAALGLPPLWLLWLFGCVYAFVIALVLQKLVLPIMPSLHAGHGLMNQDAIVFHDIAVAMADRIHVLGWSEWRLIPGNGVTANVGILAAIYALIGVDPVWFIPLNASFHALGAVLVLQLGSLFYPGKAGLIAGCVTALLFLIFPSALVWYGQNHKDAFLIAGYLLILLAFVRALNRQSVREVLYDLLPMLLGCILIMTMRPHMLMVYQVAFAVVLLALVILKLIRTRCIKQSAIYNGVLIFCILFAATAVAPKANHFLEFHSKNSENPYTEGWHWVKTGWLPEIMDRKLEQVSEVRAHFIGAGKSVGAGSAVDTDVSPSNAYEVAVYLPRAFFVGLFAPFPNTWLDRPSVPRLLGAIETLVFYLMVPGILILSWRKPTLPLFVCLLVSGVVLTVLSYSSPNVGTLHRIRFGPLFVFMVAGICGWICLIQNAISNMSKGTTACDVSNLSDKKFLISESRFSGLRTFGVGAIVTLLSTICVLGLLVRDILLINRSDFGVSLDSFYLAMMLPMLFVNILVLPLGDALTAALHRAKSHEGVQALVSATLSFSVLIFSGICFVLNMTSDQIYRLIVSNGDVSQAVSMVPIALLLLLFSGLVVSGNSLLNSLQKPILVAIAQLLVPFIAVGVILFAHESRLVLMAIVGMVVGQLINLFILIVLVYRQGFRLTLGSIKPILQEKAMLTNFAALFFVALLTSISTPLNYWLASHLGAGAISIWATGSKLVQIVTTLGVAILSSVWIPYFSKLLLAGMHNKIRREIYLFLLLGSWCGGFATLVFFEFVEPFIAVAMPAVKQDIWVRQLIGVIQIGSLQLPLLLVGLMLLKFSAVSETSWKAVLAGMVGLMVNIALGYFWLPIWGLLGLAGAGCVGSLLATLVLMITTRNQSFLGWGEIVNIVASWLVIGGIVMAIYLKNMSFAVGVGLVCIFVFFAQAKSLNMWRKGSC